MRTKKQPLTYRPNNAPTHFFASSVASWKVSENLDELLASMKKDGYPFNLFKIPLPITENYKIINYSPNVEGSTFIGFWGFEH